ncbi:hypothetical protein OSB04_008785 [Centaurea solstitialis]|uniref:CCHC-type domain-containing protein n=1 Tax=Centaurea solstitialis TaxID=347529 RepID=A0AA38TMF9_9ASTR|nr:hypothetical protein OSB04_008785 [Centaurea solstitialis]
MDHLERLGHPVPLQLATDTILNSLSEDYKPFVVNYNMNNMERSIAELHSMLKTAELNMGAKSKPKDVLMVRNRGVKKKHGQGSISKGKGPAPDIQNAPQVREKVKGKGKGKKVKANKARTENRCFTCNEVGHWRQNCPKRHEAGSHSQMKYRDAKGKANIPKFMNNEFMNSFSLWKCFITYLGIRVPITWIDYGGYNLKQSRHERKWYVLEEPLPEAPPANAPAATRNAHKKHTDDLLDVGCLMLATMSPDLQAGLMNTSAYDMIRQLRDMFQTQARTERYDATKAFNECKMIKGGPQSIAELHSMLKTAELNMGAKSKPKDVLMVRNRGVKKKHGQGSISKGKGPAPDIQNAPQVREKVKGKGKGKKVKANKARTENRCFTCNEVGHWRQNCPKRHEAGSHSQMKYRDAKGKANIPKFMNNEFMNSFSLWKCFITYLGIRVPITWIDYGWINLKQSRHERKWYVLEEPLPEAPPANAPAATRNAHKKHTDDLLDVGCLMLATMSPDLQAGLMNTSAYDMIRQLRDMFQTQARTERYDATKAFNECKMIKGGPQSIAELHSMLKTAELNMGAKSKPKDVLMVRNRGVKKKHGQGSISKGKGPAPDIQNAPQVREKVKGKGKGKKVKANKARTENRCFTCNEVGHWRQNCPKRHEAGSHSQMKYRDAKGKANIPKFMNNEFMNSFSLWKCFITYLGIRVPITWIDYGWINLKQSRHERKWYVLEEPLPEAPPANAPAATRNAHKKHTDDLLDVGCLMLATMSPDLQAGLMNTSAYDMIRQLRDMFQTQARTERYDATKAFNECKMIKGGPQSIAELHSMLKTAELNMGAKSKPKDVLMVRNRGVKKKHGQGSISKGKGPAPDIQNAPQVREKVKGKGKGKKVKANKARTENRCFTCNEVGHWRQNCPKRHEAVTSDVNQKPARIFDRVASIGRDPQLRLLLGFCHNCFSSYRGLIPARGIFVWSITGGSNSSIPGYLMLATMSPVFRTRLINTNAYNMIRQLRDMFQTQARTERYDASRALNACKMAKGTSLRMETKTKDVLMVKNGEVKKKRGHGNTSKGKGQVLATLSAPNVYDIGKGKGKKVKPNRIITENQYFKCHEVGH